MQETPQYMEEEFIIWNSTLGIRDYVMIGEVESTADTTNAWLDEPYEMVGPFCLDELLLCGQISFEACIVMSKKCWEEGKKSFCETSFAEQQRIQQEFNEELKKHNKKKKEQNIHAKHLSEKEHRELLSLPLEGLLEVTQIKAAFRKIAKTAHPDVGGSHELFVQLTQARDALLGD